MEVGETVTTETTQQVDTTSTESAETSSTTLLGTGENIVSWQDGLGDDLKGNEAFKDFQGVEDIAKAYLDLQGKVPTKPDTAEAYEVKTVEGVPVQEAALTGFRQTAFDAGLSQDQASKMVEWWNVQVVQEMQAFQAASDAAISTLKTEWGKAFDENVVLAKRAITRFGGQDLLDALNSTGTGNHPAMIKVFASIGKAMSEDVLIDGKGKPGASGEMERTPGGTPKFDFPSMRK